MVLIVPVREEIDKGQLAHVVVNDIAVCVMFTAPINLMNGDLCKVESDNGDLHLVSRNGVVVWSMTKKGDDHE